MRHPDDVAKYIAEDELKLYRLIWMRFVASQMTPAVFDQTTIRSNAKELTERTTVRATGSVPKFDGFLKDTKKAKTPRTKNDEELKSRLPKVEAGETLKLKAILPSSTH